jgi:hypothetical protein
LVPAGQLVQLLDPAGEYRPAAQESVHAGVRPVAELYLPPAQLRHEAAPVAVRYFPTAQGAQLAAPGKAAALPLLQLTQVAARVAPTADE